MGSTYSYTEPVISTTDFHAGLQVLTLGQGTSETASEMLFLKLRCHLSRAGLGYNECVHNSQCYCFGSMFLVQLHIADDIGNSLDPHITTIRYGKLNEHDGTQGV